MIFTFTADRSYTVLSYKVLYAYAYLFHNNRPGMLFCSDPGLFFASTPAMPRFARCYTASGILIVAVNKHMIFNISISTFIMVLHGYLLINHLPYPRKRWAGHNARSASLGQLRHAPGTILDLTLGPLSEIL